MSQPTKTKSQGFTLLEILLVVGIIAVLSGIVIIAINPTRQLQSVRDVQRKNDISELNKAMVQFYIDHGYYPDANNLSTTPTEVCNTGDGTLSPDCTGKLDLSSLVPTYLVSIPADPLAESSDSGTGYVLASTPTPPKIYVEAPNTELNGSDGSYVAYVGPFPSADYTPAVVTSSGYGVGGNNYCGGGGVSAWCK